MKSRTNAFLGLLLLVALSMPAAAQPSPTAIVNTYAIWPGTAPDMKDPPAKEIVEGSDGARKVYAITRPTLTAFFAANHNGAAAVVIPGGSFRRVEFDKEGTEIARWLNSLGIDAFVLKYRLLQDKHNTNIANGLMDVQRALRTVRAAHLSASVGHRLDRQKVGVIGFSAGGDLTALSGNYHATKFHEPLDEIDAFSARPDFMILGYAFLPLKSEVDEQFQFARTYGFVETISADTPPVFAFTGDADKAVSPTHTTRLEAPLRKAGVPVELHVFSGAPHGFALHGTGTEKSWPELCEKWLRGRGIIP
jgi:acetyl esterase/lipase